MLHKITAVLIAYGPLGVLLLSIADSMGIPLPAALDFLLITVAAGSVQDPKRAYLTAFLAVIGSAAGNAALFLAARQGRRWISKEEPGPEKSQRFRKWFRRYGLLTVFIPAVTPVVPLPLKVFVISAGALHSPFGTFMGVILAARIIRYFGETYLALQLGADAHGFLLRNGWTLAGIALGFVILVYGLLRMVDRRKAATTA